MLIGRAPRLVRLVAAEPCTTGCARVASIRVTGRMIGFPPGQCPRATNTVPARLSVTGEAGNPLPRSTVTARFLDEYYLDEPVTGTTGLDNVVRFVHKGPACVGTTAILVEDVAGRGGRVLDLTTGELTDSVIP